jgi:hypothetical protein
MSNSSNAIQIAHMGGTNDMSGLPNLVQPHIDTITLNSAWVKISEEKAQFRAGIYSFYMVE